jgi:hypothetical protein
MTSSTWDPGGRWIRALLVLPLVGAAIALVVGRVRLIVGPAGQRAR